MAIRRGHTLATMGTYVTIRYPDCVGLLIIALGRVLAVRSGVGVLLVVLILGAWKTALLHRASVTACTSE